jgi:hypothetical protein
MNSIVHIAPQLPPAIDGVGDYCWNLWRHWPERDVRWQFLALHNVESTREYWREVEVSGFEASADSLSRALEITEAQTVVLHYVGYGFQPKGVPLWLPEALRRWREMPGANSPRRIVTMFHEMYARSSPLRSPFWVAPVARAIIRELVRISDAWVTSCDRYSAQLVKEFGAAAELGNLIPIGSNIPVTQTGGEFTAILPFKFVLFGLAKTRLWALERHWQLLRALNEAGLVDSITLLGKHGQAADARAAEDFSKHIGGGVNWHDRFDLSAEEISRELSAHDFGLLANEPDTLTKSGVFAALASHGVVPIVSTPSGSSLPELIRNAALANDDGVCIPDVLSAVNDVARLEILRRNVLTLASRELAWPRIAHTWSNVLHGVRGVSSCCNASVTTRPERIEVTA